MIHQPHPGPWEISDDSDDDDRFTAEGGRPRPGRDSGNANRELGPEFFELEGDQNAAPLPNSRAGETAARDNRNSLRLEEIVGLIGRAWAREEKNCRCPRTFPVQIHCIGFLGKTISLLEIEHE